MARIFRGRNAALWQAALHGRCLHHVRCDVPAERLTLHELCYQRGDEHEDDVRP